MLRAVHCLWKRRLAKLNVNNPIAIADSRWWFKTNIAGVKRRSARDLCIRGSGAPRHGFQTSLRDRLLADRTYSVVTVSDPNDCLFDCS